MFILVSIFSRPRWNDGSGALDAFADSFLLQKWTRPVGSCELTKG